MYGCGCKEVYTYLYKNYRDFLLLLIPTPLVSVLFCSSIPNLCSFKKSFLFLFQYFFVIKFYVLNIYIYIYSIYSRCKKSFLKCSKLSPTIYMTIYKSTNLQAVNIKTLKSSNRSNKLMFVYLVNTG